MATPVRRPGLMRETWAFLRVRKRWWLLPVMLILAAMATFIVFAESSVAVPFIYTLF